MPTDLVLVWACIIGFAVLMYVVLDGFDLGIGILFPLVRRDRDRDRMIDSIAPVWDGNETWLVLGGGGLYAAFPLAFAVLLSAFYAPLTAMLLALIFRGVAFEFRFRDARHKRWWDLGFCAGSYVAAFAQGVVLGALVQGVAVEGRNYAGGWYDWLSPFGLATGVALVLGYGLLGATWLIMRTEGELRSLCQRHAMWLGAAVIAAIGVVSLWTPFLHASVYERWFAWPNIALLSPVPLLVLGIAILFLRGVRGQRDAVPFLLSLALFVLSYLGLGISLFPRIVPPSISLQQAAAPPESLGFMLVGAVILLPMILAYTAYAYWVFRGKVGEDHYH